MLSLPFAPIDAMLLLFVSLSTSPLPSPSLSKPPPLTRDPNERIAHNKQPFTAPSAAFWCLLSLATVVDHRRTRQLSAVTRGASVRRGIRWVVALYALDALLLLALSLLDSSAPAPGGASSKLPDVIDFVSLILEDFAEAAFLLLLLAVAAGAGIARGGGGLGPHRGKVIFVPLVYLVTTLVVDLAEVKKSLFFFGGGGGEGADREERFRSPSSSKKGEKLNLEKKTKKRSPKFSPKFKKKRKKQEYVSLKDGWLADLEGGAAGVLQGSAATLFNACQVISLVALLLAWFFVFDVAQATRRELEPQAEGIVGTAAGASVSSRSDGPSGMGHSIDLPAEVVLAAAERGDHALQETYAEVSRDAGGDEPKSAADAVATRAKLTLLRRFLMGATLYVAARAAAIVVPLAVLPAPSQADAATTAASVCEDAVRLLFLAALALIFRAREDSPYLMVGEGGAIGGDGTGVGAAGLTTELGVLRGRDEIGGSEGDFDEERPASASSRLPPPRAPLFPASELRSDASPPPQQQQKKKKAPAVALAPPPRSPALASSSSSPYRPAGAAAAPAAGAAAAGAGAARVDARFALDDDSDSDYGGGASSGGATAPAPAAAAAPGVAAPPPARRDSTEEIPL